MKSPDGYRTQGDRCNAYRTDSAAWCASVTHFKAVLPNREGHEVALGQNTDQAAIVNDRQAADLALDHDPRRLGEDGVGVRRDDLRRHDLLDP